MQKRKTPELDSGPPTRLVSYYPFHLMAPSLYSYSIICLLNIPVRPPKLKQRRNANLSLILHPTDASPAEPGTPALLELPHLRLAAGP